MSFCFVNAKATTTVTLYWYIKMLFSNYSNVKLDRLFGFKVIIEICSKHVY